MEHKHIDAAALERWLALDRTVEQNEQLFHLLAVCPRCREVGGWLLDLHRAHTLPPVFGLIDAALARSRAEAPRLLEGLLSVGPEDRLAQLEADARFWSWGLCEILVRESRRVAPEAASEARHLAELAVHTADLIQESGPVEVKWVYQLRSLAWASLGNASKVAGDLPGADRSFEMSDGWWEAGSEDVGDALGYEPVLLSLKAPLRTAQRRFSEALGLLDRAADLFLNGPPEHRDPHLAGRTLISKAFVLMEMGASAAAIEILRQAAGLIAPGRDPRLVLCIRHNVVENLFRMGCYAEASQLLPELRELALLSGTAQDRLRLDWVEGRVAAGLGDHERAGRLLSKVRQTFLDADNAFEAALAGLDLAVSYLGIGRTGEVRQLAEEMVAVFREVEIPREALAALLLFREAARRETATAALAREAAAALDRVRGSGATSGE